MEFHDTGSVTNSTVKAKKSLGQHFLTDQPTLEYIASSANNGQTIVEVGPGLGALTRHLITKTSDLLLVEKDIEFKEQLSSEFGHEDGVRLYIEDILTWNLPEDVVDYAVVANIPYFITTPIIKKFLIKNTLKPSRLTLLVQKEFAEKVVALPPKSTSLSVFIQLLAKPHISKYVPKEYFSPMPKVDSAVLHLEVLEDEVGSDLLRFVENTFRSPRKTLGNNLKMLYGKEKVSVLDPTLLSRRPETLSIKEWKSLWKIVQKKILNK